ncbi:MAG TPA: phenylalanine 4-monooxygenase [Pyrinomonadaceae bacterium]|nr:phenylalanine 4-monooxygenase [Pyrinomonadaceae bacterium]
MKVKKNSRQLLLDHVDMRLVGAETDEHLAPNDIVQLEPDHPGFRDPEYRSRRNEIARLAFEYRRGEPIPDAPYSPQEQDVWRRVWQALQPAHARHACAEYLSCVQRLQLSPDRIPQLSTVSKCVEKVSGFSLEPVAGLVEPRVFLENLAEGVFLCTQYIRHHSTPLYTPEPDVVHEIIGHAATLASERLAELNRLFGRAVKRKPQALDRLARIYWFTIEFGVLQENGELKAYGTGLLSSAGELESMEKAELCSFDLDAASYQHYDPTHYQPVLFCADSFEEMYKTLRDYLVRWQ